MILASILFNPILWSLVQFERCDYHLGLTITCVRNVAMWKSKVLIVNLLARKSLGHDGQICLNRTLRENRIANKAISRKNEITVERIETASLYL